MAALLWLLSLSGLPAAGPTAEQIDRLVQDALKAWDVPGTAIVIVGPDRVVHLKGYGVRELGGKSVTADTVFPLASCTKAFTTALVALLADEGKLHWDDPVRKHLPEFQLSDPAADRLVSLRDLAAHRTGVDSHDLLWYRSVLSQAELVKRVRHLPLSRPFRTEIQYQTIMYLALGQAAAAAGGKPWGELVESRLFNPLGMTSATLTTTAAAKRADRAAGHRPGPDGKLRTVPWYDQPEPNAAGSIHANARDLVPWLQLQLTGGRRGDEQIISEAGLRETQRPQIVIRMEGSAERLNPDTQQMSYGLGWVVQDYRGRLLLTHVGLIDGFRAHLAVLPKDSYALAILANRQGTRMNLALGNAIVDLFLGLPEKDWNKHLLEVTADEAADARVRARRIDQGRRPDQAPSVELDVLAGNYEDPAYGTATVRATPDGLVWEWGAWKLPLDHYAGDTFRLKSDGPPLDRAFVRFQVEEGSVRAFRLLGITFLRKR
jgi:CubicO group peptidase (beta-lactamase class C family)